MSRTVHAMLDRAAVERPDADGAVFPDDARRGDVLRGALLLPLAGEGVAPKA